MCGPTQPKLSSSTPDGFKSSPYASVDDALAAHKGQDIVIFTRRSGASAAGLTTEGEDVADWQRMTDSATKKAKKIRDALERKVAKTAEIQAKQLELQDAELAKIEACKAIVLEEPNLGEVETIKIGQATSRRGGGQDLWLGS